MKTITVENYEQCIAEINAEIEASQNRPAGRQLMRDARLRGGLWALLTFESMIVFIAYLGLTGVI